MSYCEYCKCYLCAQSQVKCKTKRFMYCNELCDGTDVLDSCDDFLSFDELDLSLKNERLKGFFDEW